MSDLPKWVTEYARKGQPTEYERDLYNALIIAWETLDRLKTWPTKTTIQSPRDLILTARKVATIATDAIEKIGGVGE